MYNVQCAYFIVHIPIYLLTLSLTGYITMYNGMMMMLSLGMGRKIFINCLSISYTNQTNVYDLSLALTLCVYVMIVMCVTLLQLQLFDFICNACRIIPPCLCNLPTTLDFDFRYLSVYIAVPVFQYDKKFNFYL